jgi:hypothetical protein
MNEVCSSSDDSFEAPNMDIDFLKMHVFQGVCQACYSHALLTPTFDLSQLLESRFSEMIKYIGQLAITA